jgi:hypothetical protein
MSLALLAAGPAQAQSAAGPGAACLAPAAAGEGPVAIRDAKIIVYETTVPGGGPQSRQTIIQLQACAALAGTATAYVLSYKPVLFSSDGHLLQGGTMVSNLKVPADDIAKGGPGHALINDSFSVGYAIDRTKLPKSIMITALTAGTCTPQGTGCAALPGDTPVRTVTVPVCLADGSFPPASECPAGASK